MTNSPDQTSTLEHITVTGVAQQKAWRSKMMPLVEEVRPGVWSIPVVFPGNPMRYTLSYLLVLEGEALLIDPGWESDAGEADLRSGCRAAGISLKDISGVITTHYHSDHLGMARRVQQLSGAWIAMGEHEDVRAQSAGSVGQYLQEQRRQFELWGAPASTLKDIELNSARVEHLLRLARPDLHLRDGERVPVKDAELEVMLTPGHSQGHICLIDHTHGLIFSGDHVLPRISPHIALELGGLQNPLKSYYEALERIGFEDEMEVCPAHEYRFIGMRRRVKQLTEHNRERSAEVLHVVDRHGARTVWEVARHLTWSRGWQSLTALPLRLAVSETAAHVEYLKQAGHDLDIPTRLG